MAFEFKNWFFKQFPDYHQAIDTLPNGNGEGLFQRYLKAYGLELDNGFMPFITDFVNLVDVQSTQDKFLVHLAYIMGSPPSPDGDPVLYRRILAYAMSIYKVKGSSTSYKLFLNLMGITVTNIIESVPLKKITYDMDNIIYDKPTIAEIYDSECDQCSSYQIEYSDPTNAITVDIKNKALKLISFIEPINAIFNGWVKI